MAAAIPGKFFLAVGALSGALAVVLGAYAAHGLKSVLAPDELALFHTALSYQMYHSLALILVGLWMAVALRNDPRDTNLLPLAGWCFCIGTVCFSGSLYALSFGASSRLGLLTALGGMLFIGGWLTLVAQAWRQ